MNLFLTIPLIIVIAGIANTAAKKLRVPSVVALIAVGLVIGTPGIEKALIGDNAHTISIIGDIGLLCLMFLAGLESSWKMLYKEKVDAAVVAVFGVIVPLAVGLFAFKVMGFSWKTSFIIGVCMSISAEATRAKVLMELNKMESRVGASLIGAGIIDDTIGLSLFVLIMLFVGKGNTREELLVAGSIIVFFIGLVVRRFFGHKNKPIKFVEKGMNWLLVPFFFITIGFHFEFQSLILNPWTLTAIVVIAVLAKLAGAFLTKPFLNFSWKQLHLIGWSMNSRGALELALALIAFRTNLLPNKLYSAIVIMALLTTLSFPFIMTYMVRHNEGIME